VIGEPLARRADGALEEGPLVVVEVADGLRAALARA
jgi:hypothetical protein